MTSTRLRKAFKYPADNSDEDESSHILDEEEQEIFIAKMRQENELRNQQFLRVFLALPLASLLVFLPALFRPSPLRIKILAFLCSSSLLATAYMLLYIPNKVTGQRRNRAALSSTLYEPSPMNQYLTYLNAALSLLLAANAIAWRGSKGGHESFWLLCILPAAVLAVCIVFRRMMLDVDIDELEGLKYGYKGA